MTTPRGERAIALGVALVALALAGTMTAVYIVSPRVETRTVVKAVPRETPARPTLGEFRRLLEPVAVIQETYTMSPDGRPFYCAVTDSTFDPEATKGIRWQAQYCWEVTQEELAAAAGGPKG